MKKIAVVILAAGEGTRMKSSRPKVLHSLSGKPLIRWVLSAVNSLSPAQVFMVVGHGGEEVQKELSNEKVVFVRQDKQLGSGHALLQAEKHLGKFSGNVLVLCGDTPLIQPETLKSLFRNHTAHNNSATILSSEINNPHGYGRIYRLPSGLVEAIVEEKDATAEQRKIKEINSGIYFFKSPEIWKVLKKIKNNNVKKEYYLTDAISILNDKQDSVGAYNLAQFEEVHGVNTRIDLANAEKFLRKALLEKLMAEGVAIINPDNTYISPDSVIGKDTIIYPGTMIEGKTTIGNDCIIGPNSYIKDSSVGSGTEIRASFVNASVIHDNVKIGPFANLRPGSVLKSGSKVGNFSEIKKSTIGEGSKVNHLSYIGDTEMGKEVNVGAGTITCNYDGEKKHKTIIEDGVFIGSNVNLVAPVKVGKDALIGAGSTITDDIPPKHLAIARERQINKKR